MKKFSTFKSFLFEGSGMRYLLIMLGLVLLWTAIHIPGIKYGTSSVPLHVSYMTADEQSPVNGGLHMLEKLNPFEIRKYRTLYYGPIFAVSALPGIVSDYAFKYLNGEIGGPEDYRNHIVWDWGGILIFERILTVIISFLALLSVYGIFRSKTMNPSGKNWISGGAAVIMALSYLFFEYSHFFRHWIFVICIFIWQIHLMIKIEEGPSKKSLLLLYWIGECILTVAVFGISYIGIMYEILWLPLLVKWLYGKDWERLRHFILYAVACVAGMLAVIWWYPYGFVRTLSMSGIIPAPTAQGAVLGLVDVPSGHSFWFYMQTILVNDLTIIIAGLILFGILWSHRIYGKYWVWALLLPAILNYLIFSIPSHHETRYTLMTVIPLVILVMGLFSNAHKLFEWSGAVRVSGLLIGIYIIANTVQILGWQRMILGGPVERREVLGAILEWQEKDPSAKILVFKDWPLGWVHTKEAYAEYMETRNKSGYNLWQNMLQIPPPRDVLPINVFYKWSNLAVNDSDGRDFDHIVVWKAAKINKDIWDGSPNDQFDYRPWTVWKYQDFQDRYTIVK